MKKYKFCLSETSWIECTEEELNGCKPLILTDGNKDIKVTIFPIKRYDGLTYYLIAPIEMFEEIKDEQLRKD